MANVIHTSLYRGVRWFTHNSLALAFLDILLKTHLHYKCCYFCITVFMAFCHLGGWGMGKTGRYRLHLNEQCRVWDILSVAIWFYVSKWLYLWFNYIPPGLFVSSFFHHVPTCQHQYQRWYCVPYHMPFPSVSILSCDGWTWNISMSIHQIKSSLYTMRGPQSDISTYFSILKFPFLNIYTHISCLRK